MYFANMSVHCVDVQHKHASKKLIYAIMLLIFKFTFVSISAKLYSRARRTDNNWQNKLSNNYVDKQLSEN